jgi:hypothetical protein
MFSHALFCEGVLYDLDFEAQAIIYLIDEMLYLISGFPGDYDAYLTRHGI